MTDSHPPEAGASFAEDGSASDLPANPTDASPFTRPPPGSLVAPFLENNFTDAWQSRHDGWTPGRKRLFLDDLAQWGIVARAAKAAGMSAQSAYDLRNRDPLFDAGWKAALHLARQRLPDELMARSLNGVVEQIHRDGTIVGERHRYDNRLSLGLLNRLDRIAERDEERGAAHPRAAANWAAYLDAMGEGRDDDARAILDPEAAAAAEAARNAPEHQVHQVSLGEDEDEYDDYDPFKDDPHMVWEDEKDRDKVWTNYPPPEGFEGTEVGAYRGDNYKRTLAPEEAASWRGVMDELRAETLADGEAQRRAFFFGEGIEEGVEEIAGYEDDPV